MKTVVYTKYGPPDVLEFKEVDIPAPKDDELLIRVHAASVNAYDWHLLSADIVLVRLMGGGLFKPKITKLGADLAGRVEAVGNNVKQFKPGDAVFGDISECGNGAFSEYVSVRERAMAPKPCNLSFEQAAAVPMAAITALQGLRDFGKLQPGQKVLIHGASGGVGTFAVQLAKQFGAHVTAVCSTRNLEMARALGADEAIDYTKEDITESGRRFDLILGVNGYHSLAAYRSMLNPGGIYAMAGGTTAQIFQGGFLGPLLSKSGTKKMVAVAGKPSKDDLLYMKGLLEAGKVVTVIDRCYPFSEIREALRYQGEGHARGKIVITVAANGRDKQTA